MAFFTGVYRGENVNWSVGVQRLVRRDGVPVLFACLGHEMPWQKEKTVAELTDWFYDTALGLCEKGREEPCADRVYRAFCKQYGQSKVMEAGGHAEDHAGRDAAGTAVFFAMGTECFYVWRGQVGITCYQILFNRVKGRSLTGTDGAETQKPNRHWQWERAVWEPGAGILLGSSTFLRAVGQRESELAECLRAMELKSAEHTQRHLQELGSYMERQGLKETAAIFCVAA